jgi:hypothetical protein
MFNFNQFLNESRRFYATQEITNSLLDDVFPLGVQVDYSQERLELAISLGMVVEIGYRGLKDPSNVHKRTICPLILGTSKRGIILTRAYHLLGWSVSVNNNIVKIWRLFRTENIEWMLFNGQFFRDAPVGYNQSDPILNPILRADFNRIKSNQDRLKSSNMIETEKEVQLPIKIKVKDQGIINLITQKPDPLKKYTFLKSKTSPTLICIEGGLSQKDKIITIEIGNTTDAYEVHDAYLGNKLPKEILGQTEFKLFIEI